MARRRKKLPKEPVSAKIESLSHEGRGIAHVEGKTVFVNGALPGEDALFQYKKQRPKYDEAHALEITNPAAERVDAKCEFFGLCGGCSLQHMQHDFQIEHKQSVLMEQLTHIGKVKPKSVIPPLTGPQWGYRRKARLGVKYVEKKERVLVGFREKYSPFIADMNSCEVLHPSVASLIEPLQLLITELSLIKQIPQIEVAVGDDVVALIFRHLSELTDEDKEILKSFAEHHQADIYLQSGGVDSVVPLEGSTPRQLSYELPEFDLTMNFLPIDFTQVNTEINCAMVPRALELLEVNSEDRVLDLFCGIGNFTLPLARKAAIVLGIEGEHSLVERAKQNAELNNISNVEFRAIDLANEQLFDEMLSEDFLKGEFNKLLLDPARNGAREVIEKMNLKLVEKIVYVSCNPATLARDAGILVNDKDFKLEQAGIMDMFPHTTHVESIAVFSRKKK
ncbi:MAG: 23S rRNA (uracil(1939)-C(5))-methyltransferase RlmD [Gammaproteobacteria bacterium]